MNVLVRLVNDESMLSRLNNNHVKACESDYHKVWEIAARSDEVEM